MLSLRLRLNFPTLWLSRCHATVAPAAIDGDAAYTTPQLNVKAIPRRTGVLAVKKGMTEFWDDWGIRHAVTVLQLDEVQVLQVKHHELKNRTMLQLGCMDRNSKRVNHSLRCHFEKAGVPVKRKIADFMVTPDSVLPVGFKISAAHFVPGQYVNVQGITTGKGFQGAMKRWGFKGLPASHGVSRAHRSLGSTGCRQDPGKTWKGKKMHGHMGCKNATMECLQVLKVDTAVNAIYVKGSIPGTDEGFVKITDALKRKSPVPLPFPTYFPKPNETPKVMQWMGNPKDPLLRHFAS